MTKFAQLPKEIRQRVFSYVPQGHLIGSVALVCRTFREDVLVRSAWKYVDYRSLENDAPHLPLRAKFNFLKQLGDDFVEDIDVPFFHEVFVMDFVCRQRNSLRNYSGALDHFDIARLFEQPLPSLNELVVELINVATDQVPTVLMHILGQVSPSLRKLHLVLSALEDFDQDRVLLLQESMAIEARPNLTELTVESRTDSVVFEVDFSMLARLFPNLETLNMVRLEHARERELLELLEKLPRLRELIVGVNLCSETMALLARRLDLVPGLERIMVSPRAAFQNVPTLYMARLFVARPRLSAMAVHCSDITGACKITTWSREPGSGMGRRTAIHLDLSQLNDELVYDYFAPGHSLRYTPTFEFDITGLAGLNRGP